METGIHNTSEIGRLRKVLLHRPGQELENLMPEYLERLLFDDIPYLKEAQAEHDAFAQCLRDAGVEVVYLIDLVVNSLTSPEVRQELVTQFLKEADLPDEAAGKAVAEYLSELDDSKASRSCLLWLFLSTKYPYSKQRGKHCRFHFFQMFVLTKHPYS